MTQETQRHTTRKKTRASGSEENAFRHESRALLSSFLICNAANLTYNLALS
jgi:hypothetical protein